MSRALTRPPPPVTTLQGTAEATGELLRAPASGTPCVHWRLRIVEHLAPGLEFVHEVVSPEALEIVCRLGDPERVPTPPRDGLRRAKPAYAHAEARADSGRPAARVRLMPEDARLQALPMLFREGTPGALAVAQQFGLRGTVRVEEVVIRHGDPLEAEGVLSDPAAALSRGPFRTIEAPLELLSPSLRLETGLSLRPVILPWALGTAAALLTSTGLGAAIVHYVKGKALGAASLPFPAEIGTRRPMRWHWP